MQKRLPFVPAVLVAMLALTQPAYGQCIHDEDWPEKPCLDMPPYSKSYLKEAWQGYYDYKGQEWMEMKKAEMDQAIGDGTLEKWVEYRDKPNNFANYNVYFYYFLNDQAPDVDGYGYFFARSDLEPVITYWYVSPGGMATLAAAAAATVTAVFLFRRTRQRR